MSDQIHYIEHNGHKAVRQHIRAYFYDNRIKDADVAPGELEKILQTDELWIIRWYPEPHLMLRVAVASSQDRALQFAGQLGMGSEPDAYTKSLYEAVRPLRSMVTLPRSQVQRLSSAQIDAVFRLMELLGPEPESD